MTDEMRKFKTTVIVLLTIVLLWTAFLSMHCSTTAKPKKSVERAKTSVFTFAAHPCSTKMRQTFWATALFPMIPAVIC